MPAVRLEVAALVLAALAGMPAPAGAAPACASQAPGELAPAGPGPTGTVSQAQSPLKIGWYARIETSEGEIVARLLPDQAPQSVAHFAALAMGRLPWLDPITGEQRRGHYYDGLLVHKAVAGERFEAGDPTGTGHGAPLIYVPPEGFGPVNFSGGWRLGMTRSSLGKISGAVFFVTVSVQPWLNRRHPCFGVVVRGRDVVERICSVRTDSGGRPLSPIRIQRIRVFAVGNPPPLPEPEAFHPKVPKLQPRRRGTATPAPKGRP